MSSKHDEEESLEDTKRFPPDPGEEKESTTLDDHVEGDPLEAEEDVSVQEGLGDEEEESSTLDDEVG